MPQHIVKQGDHISKIARQYGFEDYETIWDHPENAAIAEQRQDPHILFPGDRLYIPEKEEKYEVGSTNQRHHFQLIGQQIFLRLRLLDTNWNAIANKPIELRVDHLEHELTTNGDGEIEQSINKKSEYATLSYTETEDNFDVIIPMHIGSLDPVDTEPGQKARLNNLGYFAGPPEDIKDQNTDSPEEAQQFQSAVEEFQCDHDLEVNGFCEATTQAKLVEIHGC